MKTQALTHNQVLSRISEFYHDDFRQVAQSVLQPNEGVIWVGNTTHRSQGLNYFGYLLITSYRLILVKFPVERGMFGLGREIIHSEKGHYSSDAEALGIPSRPLTAKEKQSRYMSEATFQHVSRVERREIRASRRQDTVLIELYVLLSPNGALGSEPILFYSFQDGQEVYEILQNAMRGKTIEKQESLIDKLERLALLHERKELTDDEYEQAKQRLLNE